MCVYGNRNAIQFDSDCSHSMMLKQHSSIPKRVKAANKHLQPPNCGAALPSAVRVGAREQRHLEPGPQVRS